MHILSRAKRRRSNFCKRILDKTPTNIIIIEKDNFSIMTSNPESDTNRSLLEQFRETRSRTLEIVKTLEKDDFVVQTSFFMSPPKWHVGHV
jgi:hypothetical protein